MDALIENGKPAPAIELPDLDGQNHILADLLGKIVILNFWSAECPWSERADLAIMPLLEKWDAQVAYFPIASNANESIELLRSAASQRGLPVLLVDAGQRAAEAFGAQTTPHCFILDKAGMLRYQGAFDDVTFRQRTPTINYVEAAVESLLREEQPAPNSTPPYGCTIVRYSGE